MSYEHEEYNSADQNCATDIGYTKIPNAILENLHGLTAGDVKVILAICRWTIGFHRQRHLFSLSFLTQKIGISRPTAAGSISKLVEKGWIEAFEAKTVAGQDSRQFSLSEELVKKMNQLKIETGKETKPVKEFDRLKNLTGGGKETKPEVVKKLNPNKDTSKETKERNNLDPEGAVGSSANAAALPHLLDKEKELDTPPQTPSPQQPKPKPILRGDRQQVDYSTNAVARSEARMSLDYSGGKKYHPRYLDFVENEVAGIWDPSKGEKNNGWSDAVLKNAEANLKKQNREHGRAAVLRYINNLLKANDWGNLELLLDLGAGQAANESNSKFGKDLDLNRLLHRDFQKYQGLLEQLGHTVKIHEATQWQVRFELDDEGYASQSYTMFTSTQMENRAKARLAEKEVAA